MKFQKTAKAWLEILERMYLVFSIRPFTRSLPRAVTKPPKVYFFDNADIIGEEVSKSLLYYANRLKPKKATQIVANLKRPYDKNGISVTDPLSYFDHSFGR